MYHVQTIITPISYAVKLSQALDKHSDNHAYKLTQLDCCILYVLKEANTSMYTKPIMLAVRRRMYMQRFDDAIARLISAKLIHRTQRKRTVYYSITHAGKNVLKELDEHLIALVQAI